MADLMKTLAEELDAAVKTHRFSLDYCLPSDADLALILNDSFRFGASTKAGLASKKTIADLLRSSVGLHARPAEKSASGRPTYRIDCAHGTLLLGEQDDVPEGRLLIYDGTDTSFANEKAHAVVTEIGDPPLNEGQ